MRGKYARVTAISPRPDGTYRFSIRMRAAAAMSVTIQALGVWETFNITTSWAQYDMLINEPVGDNIDIYPLSDTTMYVEKLQLTYGKAVYEWRPAPEDEVEYEWTRVALDEVTVENIREIVSYTEYFYLSASGTEPAAPTTNPPPVAWTTAQSLAGSYTATASVTSPTHSITAAAVTAATFARAINSSGGLFRITYNGTSWMYAGNVINLRNYGISVSGTPSTGDSILVTLQISSSAAWYMCPLTVYSDGSFRWGDVTLSTAFDAAKSAINTSTTYQTQVQQLMDNWNVTVRGTTVNDTTQETVADLLGRIQVTESTVSNLIEETRISSDGLGERLTSYQEQTSRDITNYFSSAKQYADEQYGGTKKYVVDAEAWQRFSADGIEQGRSDSPFKSKLTNTELGFYENDQKVAYISNSKFLITNGQINNTLTVGNYIFTSNNGELGIIYSGGSGS